MPCISVAGFETPSRRGTALFRACTWRWFAARAKSPRIWCARFVSFRSSSAHLDTRVWRRLESAFGCPASNAYGMTEAAHQVASTRLPPGDRNYGSVGSATGPEVTILDDRCEEQPPGRTGEIAIRGDSVIQRYPQPLEANQTAFSNNWLRTGDKAFAISQGRVTISGRLKELINIGGEKVSPAEIDAVLMQHPAVIQVVTFGVSCESRGERICAAVVLESEATETDLKNFVRESGPRSSRSSVRKSHRSGDHPSRILERRARTRS